jgi:hypothetical protein
MDTFHKFLENRLLLEADPMGAPAGGPPGGGGVSGPGALPGGAGGMPPPMGGGLGGAGGGLGGLGGLGGPGGPPPGGAPQTTPEKLKSYNVWDVLEKILSKS